MKAIGKIEFSIEAEAPEIGGIRTTGDYAISQLGRTAYIKQDFRLLKGTSDIAIALGGLTTVEFLYIEVFFDDDTVSDADVELKLDDGSGDQVLTGTQFLVSGGDYTSLKLSNNTHITTGSDATISYVLLGV